jgi:DNA-binding XRE family transcriptional regulator
MSMKLATYLKRKKISHAEFARRVGVTRQSIYNYARQTSPPRLETALKIVAETRGRVTLRELLDVPAEQDENEPAAA